MKTLTETMLAKVEEWKAGYAELIRGEDRPEVSLIDWNQYRRLTAVECYLEARLAR